MSDVLQNLAPKTRFALLSSSVGGLKSKKYINIESEVAGLKTSRIYATEPRKLQN